MQITLKSAIDVFLPGYEVDSEHTQIDCVVPDTPHVVNASGEHKQIFDPARMPSNWRVWDPLNTDTALFRKFAVIGQQYRQTNPVDALTRLSQFADPTQREVDLRPNVAREIVEFSGTYGLPCIPERHGLPPHNVSLIHRYAMTVADAIMVMDAILADDRETLGRYFRFKEGFGWEAQELEFHDLVDVAKNKLYASPQGGIVQCARTALDDLIAENSWPAISIKPGIAPSGERAVLGLVTNLLDVIWLQLATAYLEEKQFRECATCSSPFEIAPDVHRTNRRFCSDTCRVKHYQRRRARAIRLRSQGEDLHVIALEVDASVEQVTKWCCG